MIETQRPDDHLPASAAAGLKTPEALAVDDAALRSAAAGRAAVIVGLVLTAAAPASLLIDATNPFFFIAALGIGLFSLGWGIRHTLREHAGSPYGR